MKPRAEKIRDYLLKCICEQYGMKSERLISDEARRACWSFVLGAEEEGQNPGDECRRYVDWLAYAAMHSKDQHPPKSAETACLDIAMHYGKACAWSKFKLDKSTAFAPKPNPHLHDDRPPEAIPSPEELASFSEQLRAIFNKQQI